MKGYKNYENLVSVPIRGLFNLTEYEEYIVSEVPVSASFRPHQGII